MLAVTLSRKIGAVVWENDAAMRGSGARAVSIDQLTGRHAFMTYVRVYAGPDGESHLEDVTVDMAPTTVFPGLPLLGVAAPIPVTALILVGFPAEARDAGWRCPPRRQFVVFGAAVEVTVSDGAIRQIPAGSPVLFEDTSGKGHATRVLADGDTLVLFLPMAE